MYFVIMSALATGKHDAFSMSFCDSCDQKCTTFSCSFENTGSSDSDDDRNNFHKYAKDFLVMVVSML